MDTTPQQRPALHVIPQPTTEPAQHDCAGDLSLSATPGRIANFWRKVEQTDDGCWTWGATITPLGYGAFYFEGAMRPAHRFAYRLFVGPIAEGMELDHLCRNRACVNPAHLEQVTHRENTLRGETVTAINAAKTHCHVGHPLHGDNLYVVPGTGARNCRECKRTANARSQRLRRARRRVAA